MNENHFSNLDSNKLLMQCSDFLQLGQEIILNKINAKLHTLKETEKFKIWQSAWEATSQEVNENLTMSMRDASTELKNIYKHPAFLKIGMASVGVIMLFNTHSTSTQEHLTPSKQTYPIYKSVFHNKAEAFLNLVKNAEGLSYKFYLDNIGIATAYGWNPTRNSKKFNVDLAHKIGLSNKETKIIASISSDENKSQVQFIPKQLKKMLLTKKQTDKSAEIMLDFYETEFIKVLKIKAKQNHYDENKAVNFYKKMPSNQQVVMVHMAYKLGTTGLLKYNGFFKNLITYMDNPNQNNFNRIATDFEYSYKDREGNKQHDEKVEKIHTAFFNACATDINNKNILNKDKVINSIKECQKLVTDTTSKPKLSTGNS